MAEVNLHYNNPSNGYLQHSFGNIYDIINTYIPNISYSGIERQSIDNLVESEPVLGPAEVTIRKHDISLYADDSYKSTSQSQAYDVAERFLSPIRPVTQFINEAWMVRDYIIDAFRKLTGKDFPNDIIVKVCGKEMMKRIHGQNNSRWREGILGFAINNRPKISEIFIMQGSLDRLMLVVGHELGHVLSHRLSDTHDEEAKAFAFELAWAQTIKENDIGGLGESITTELGPAVNGLHDVAWDFVQRMMRNGNHAMQIFMDLIHGDISIKSLYP